MLPVLDCSGTLQLHVCFELQISRDSNDGVVVGVFYQTKESNAQARESGLEGTTL
jgi:hypothetical protein